MQQLLALVGMSVYHCMVFESIIQSLGAHRAVNYRTLASLNVLTSRTSRWDRTEQITPDRHLKMRTGLKEEGSSFGC